MMQRPTVRRIVALVLSLHLAVALVASPAFASTSPRMASGTTQAVALEYGAGWADLLTCASCVAAGAVVVSSIGAVGVVTAAIVGGAEAVGGALYIAGCVTACYNAFAE